MNKKEKEAQLEYVTKIFDNLKVIKRTVRPEPKDGTCLIKECSETAVNYGVYTFGDGFGGTLFKACQKHLDEYSNKELELNPFEMKPLEELAAPQWLNNKKSK